ncbi:MAG: gamma-glutamyl-gamma-aminobutyrate hydrolase family protein [Firmicutes bacterium]|nr:gamma-glutamyl-gamma-aminobutyrate hydrolase family protein [Bacillota bacterium]
MTTPQGNGFVNSKPIIGITCGHTFEGSGRFYVNEPYVRCIEAAGGLPFIIPGLKSAADLDGLLDYIDGLLLPGGVDVAPIHFDEEPIPALGDVNPVWDELELYAARAALHLDLPILGICRGAQLLNVAAGGTLYQDIDSQIPGPLYQHTQKAPNWYPSHSLSVEEGTLLAEIFGSGDVRVNSFHHQSIKEPARGFEATARSSDGIIEAVESRMNSFVLGVQWHPEHMVGYYPRQMKLFTSFIDAAMQRKGRCKAVGTGSTAESC